MVTADWVSAIAACFNTVGIGALVWQIQVMRRQTNADHARCRREKAIELLEQWTRSISRATTAARRFAEKLDANQSKSLWNQETFTVLAAHRDLIVSSLTDAALVAELQEKGDELVIPQRVATAIRWQVVVYLNQLETVFTAVRHGVADEQIIQEQFGYIVDPKRGECVVERFRQAAGTQNYPAIEERIIKARETAKPQPGLKPISI